MVPEYDAGVVTAETTNQLIVAREPLHDSDLQQHAAALSNTLREE